MGLRCLRACFFEAYQPSCGQVNYADVNHGLAGVGCPLEIRVVSTPEADPESWSVFGLQLGLSQAKVGLRDVR